VQLVQLVQLVQPVPRERLVSVQLDLLELQVRLVLVQLVQLVQLVPRERLELQVLREQLVPHLQ
jgi:hypothetical protein